jgi:hypothetical protein
MFIREIHSALLDDSVELFSFVIESDEPSTFRDVSLQTIFE